MNKEICFQHSVVLTRYGPQGVTLMHVPVPVPVHGTRHSISRCSLLRDLFARLSYSQKCHLHITPHSIEGVPTPAHISVIHTSFLYAPSVPLRRVRNRAYFCQNLEVSVGLITGDERCGRTKRTGQLTTSKRAKKNTTWRVTLHMDVHVHTAPIMARL